MKYHPTFWEFFKSEYCDMYSSVQEDLKWAKRHNGNRAQGVLGLFAITIGMIILGPFIFLGWLKERELYTDKFIDQL